MKTAFMIMAVFCFIVAEEGRSVAMRTETCAWWKGAAVGFAASALIALAF